MRHAQCHEKIWFEAGLETGEDNGKVLIVTQALYGLKSSGGPWTADLAATLRDLNFKSMKADQNVWIRSAGTHYDKVLVSVANILVLAKHRMVTMKYNLDKLYELKPESVKEPEINVGAKTVQWPHGKLEGAMGSNSCVEKQHHKGS